MREKFARFMMGRYGLDPLGKVISTSALIFIVLSMLLSRIAPTLGSTLWIVSLFLIILCYYRMFSKNISARAAENQKFQSFRYSFAVKKQHRAERAAQKKDYKFFKCPKCGVLNRIPKGKGKIQITCPKCGEQFIRKS